MKKFAVLVLLVLLVPCHVMADEFEYKGETWTYYPELGETQESITAVIDYIMLGPPPPPDWPIETPKAPITYSNQDSSDARPAPSFDFTGEEYWLYT